MWTLLERTVQLEGMDMGDYACAIIRVSEEKYLKDVIKKIEEIAKNKTLVNVDILMIMTTIKASYPEGLYLDMCNLVDELGDKISGFSVLQEGNGKGWSWWRELYNV